MYWALSCAKNKAWLRCVQVHECLRGVCRVVFATRACPSFCLCPLSSSPETENRGKEARATLNSSAALDNVCAGKKKTQKKRRLRFYDSKTITLHQAPYGGQSLPCPGAHSMLGTVLSISRDDITASSWPPTMWVLLSSPGFYGWGNAHPETSCHFPQNHLEGQQPTPASQQRCWDNYLPPYSSAQKDTCVSRHVEKGPAGGTCLVEMVLG